MKASILRARSAQVLQGHFTGQSSGHLGLYYLFDEAEVCPTVTEQEDAALSTQWASPVVYGVGDHPVAIAQDGLVSYDRFCATADRRFLLRSESAGHRLLELQHQDGSWHYSFPFIDLEPGWTSAMAQGQAISLLCRLHEASRNDDYLMAARRSFQYMLTPVEAGGTLGSFDDGAPFLEEYPRSLVSPQTLNGAIFALWGIRDLALHEESKEYMQLFTDLARVTAEHLSEFRAPEWSLYSLREGRLHLASDRYQRVHIIQTLVMFELTGQTEWIEVSREWRHQYARKWGRNGLDAWINDTRSRLESLRGRSRA